VDAPARFVRAQDLRGRLEAAGIWFAPVRHHSPACARAVRALIDEVGPVAVLIEGPAEFDALLPSLTDAATAPPVAVLSLHEGPDSGDTAATFYPLADFSPEWVALREADARGARIAFIDAGPAADERSGGPRSDPADGERVEGTAAGVAALRGERYFAESRALAELARREHCRDHDELWEHLFESRGPTAPWRELFGDVFAWSALARLDYEPEVLAAEGSIRRESVMAGHVAQWRETVDGPVVVVTGAFHTLALIEALAARLDLAGPTGGPIREAEPVLAGMTPASRASREAGRPGGAWLVRYDLRQLDALTGYGAGVRSPGFFQREWDAGAAEQGVAAACLTEVAHAVNAAGTSERLSPATVIEASLQAHRLARLRGHMRPGRTDLLDACLSCFAQGEPSAALRDGIRRVFGGSKTGAVPPGAPAPPIVAEARELARELRFDVSDSARRATTLNVRRSGRARRRSRFLWLMDFLDTGFARRVTGPDYASGVLLGRAQERWEYAWTPLVEAALTRLAAEGTTLSAAARARLRAIESRQAEAGQGRSSAAVAQIVAEAVLIGLADEVERLEGRLDRIIGQDPNLSSVMGALRRVMSLWRAREWLGIESPERLTGLVRRGLPQLIYLVGETGAVKADDEPEAVAALVGVHELLAYLEDTGSADMVRDTFARLRVDRATAPGVLGAVMGLGVVSGDVPDADLARRVEAVFAPGADSDYASRFLGGVMRAAPDLLVHAHELFDAVDHAVATLDEAAFLEFLPELRRGFARLRPFETGRLAGRIAAAHGGDGSGVAADAAVEVTQFLSETDLSEGIAVELALRESLARDALLGWAAGTASADEGGDS
jgi:hypothetical protein